MTGFDKLLLLATFVRQRVIVHSYECEPVVYVSVWPRFVWPLQRYVCISLLLTLFSLHRVFVSLNTHTLRHTHTLDSFSFTVLLDSIRGISIPLPLLAMHIHTTIDTNNDERRKKRYRVKRAKRDTEKRKYCTTVYSMCLDKLVCYLFAWQQ